MIDGDGDPYRDAAGARCPRCTGVLTERADAFTCNAGCGEWIPYGKLDTWMLRSSFDKRVHGQLWMTGDGGRCPACGATMSTRGGLYDHCSDHGAWVDARQRNNFRAQFADAIRDAKRVVELEAQLHDRRAIAERIVALENDIAALRAELKKH